MSSYSEGQVHQLMEKFEAEGFTAADITRLGQFDNLHGILEVINRHLRIVAIEHVIDCDIDPYIPDGWTVEEHIKGGQFKWDPAAVALYLSKKQKKRGVITGNDLYKELKGKPVLNANILDYLRANPYLIPKEGKGKFLFFWGTIYCFSDGSLSVRFLYWDDGQWHWHYRRLDHNWFDSGPAVLARK